jgi:quercetin dioxygenase-like cupin family protein
MGKISIRHQRDIPTYVAKDRMSPERDAQMTSGEVNSVVTRYYPNDGETLNFFQVEVEPNGEVGAHAHTAAEVIYVVRGELRLGAQTAEPGTAIFID